jgi:hypothetical protein
MKERLLLRQKKNKNKIGGLCAVAQLALSRDGPGCRWMLDAEQQSKKVKDGSNVKSTCGPSHTVRLTRRHRLGGDRNG